MRVLDGREGMGVGGRAGGKAGDVERRSWDRQDVDYMLHRALLHLHCET
jgi:hypothetical protein